MTMVDGYDNIYDDNDNCNDGMTMVDGYDHIYDENDNGNDNIDNDNYGDYDPTL